MKLNRSKSRIFQALGSLRGLFVVLLLVGIFIFPPLIALALKAISGTGINAVKVDNLLRLLADTLIVASGATLFALVLGLPSAFLTTRTNLPGRSIWRTLLPLPLVIPPYIGALTVIDFLGPMGTLNKFLSQLTGEPVRLFNIYSLGGGIFVLGLFTYPYVYLTVSSALEKMNPSLEEAVHTLGLSGKHVFFKLTLPLILPAILSGSLLVFLYAFADFGAVSMLRIETFTRAIFFQLNTQFNLGAAALLSSVLILVTILILVVQNRLLGKAGYIQTTGRTRQAELLDLGKWRWCALAFLLSVILISLVAPIWILLNEIGSFETFLKLATRQGNYIWNSLWTATGAATIGTALALVITMISSKKRFGGLVWGIAQLGYAIPGTVLAVGMVIFYNTYLPMLYRTGLILIIAYLSRFLTQALQSIGSAYLQVSPSLIEAARTLGQGPIRAAYKILLPILRPGLISGWLLIFISSLKELAATLILRPAGFDTLPVRIFIQSQETSKMTEPAVLAILLMLLAGIPSFLLNRLEKRVK